MRQVLMRKGLMLKVLILVTKLAGLLRKVVMLKVLIMILVTKLAGLLRKVLMRKVLIPKVLVLILAAAGATGSC